MLKDLVVCNIKQYKILTNTNPSLSSYNAYWDVFGENILVCEERSVGDVDWGGKGLVIVDRGGTKKTEISRMLKCI